MLAFTVPTRTKGGKRTLEPRALRVNARRSSVPRASRPLEDTSDNYTTSASAADEPPRHVSASIPAPSGTCDT